MLSQLERLSFQVDGRYASDAELQFLVDYVQSFRLRVETYQRLRDLELTLVKETHTKMQAIDPTLFQIGNQDLVTKWKRDTISTLRYSAVAVLINDSETLQERFLDWFQTMIRAFGAQRSCDVTYQVMQTVVKQHFSSAQADLICPILELNRRSLGMLN
ncbi:MAG: phycobilisome protein [Leptolyngbyaceae cyanobacterium SL_7_1]|nr:phycobilisome protein [Leptolyngbyaceae cyanobacterium SL_7_1]